MKTRNYILPHILAMDAYSSARSEMILIDGVFLDANENPFGDLNRYPDPYQLELKSKLAKLKNVNVNQLFIGNGSDEVIDLLIRTTCQPGKDKMAIFTPTYGMYEVSAALNNVEVVKMNLNESFEINPESFSSILEDEQIKLVIFCSPNNPTGNCLQRTLMESFIEQFNGLVLIDEAYIEFSNEASWINALDKYDNLLISQTFSKAYGLAAARVGVAYSSSFLISILTKIKPPYNVSLLNQQAALKVLENQTEIENQIQLICSERERLLLELSKIACVHKVFPSDANFILVKVRDANFVYQQLVGAGIIVRNRTKVIDNSLRITIGTPDENEVLLNELKKIQ